jgi:large subunit ribosomal protein L24
MARKLRIKADDTVVVIAGKDKGKTGRVLRVDPAAERVYVEGLNIVKRHQKPVAGRPNMQVGVIEKEGAIHVSNVALADPKDGRPTRVGIRRTDAGKPIRVTKRSGTEVD